MYQHSTLLSLSLSKIHQISSCNPAVREMETVGGLGDILMLSETPLTSKPKHSLITRFRAILRLL